MIIRYRTLADRMRHELTLLGEVVQQRVDAMERAEQNPSDRDFYVAAAALHLTIPLTGVRPAVFARETAHRLDEYLRFRHVVRNVYALYLDAERVRALVAGLRSTYERAREELEEFGRFLEHLSWAE